MPGSKVSARKLKYEETLLKCLSDFKKVLVIEVDNVGSKQLSDTRVMLRGKAQILMGKNTVIRTVLKREMAADAGLESLKNKIRGNIGFVFTNGDLMQIRDSITEKKNPAPAKAGQVAPSDVYVEAGPTGLDPGMTAFFQALNIPTKINRGSIEIVARQKMCTEGEKVTASASALLSKLNIMPFAYGIKVKYVYESGSCYDAKVLDLTEADLMSKFSAGMNQIASLSLGLGYPTTVSVPHLMSNAVRKLISFCIETKYNIDVALPYKAALGLDCPAPAEKKEEAAAAAGGDDDDDDDDDDEE